MVGRHLDGTKRGIAYPMPNLPSILTRFNLSNFLQLQTRLQDQLLNVRSTTFCKFPNVLVSLSAATDLAFLLPYDPFLIVPPIPTQSNPNVLVSPDIATDLVSALFSNLCHLYSSLTS